MQLILSGNVLFEQSSHLDTSIQNMTFSHLLNGVLPQAKNVRCTLTYKKRPLNAVFFNMVPPSEFESLSTP